VSTGSANASESESSNVLSSVFKPNSEYDKPSEFYNAPMVEGSLLNIPNIHTAKPHRVLFTQAFSKAAVNRLEPLIHDKLNLFLSHLREAAANDEIVDLGYAFCCLTADVTMHYCYQMSLGLLDAPKFKPALIVDMHDAGPIIPVFWYLPESLGRFLNKIIFELLPDNIVKSAVPAAASTKAMTKQCRSLIESLRAAPANSKEVERSIFAKALNPNIEKGQYIATPEELTADAMLMFLAGTDTTGNTLAFGIWEMIKNPTIWTTLRKEVDTVLPDVETIANVQELETLPYLVSARSRVSCYTS